MTSHHPLSLDIRPITLLKNLLEVDTLLIRPRKQHLDHHNNIQQNREHLKRKEEIQIDALVLHSQKYDEADEGKAKNDVDEHVEPVEFALD